MVLDLYFVTTTIHPHAYYGLYRMSRLMWKTTPITLFFLVTLMPWLDPPGVINFNWNLYNSTIIGISALLGFLLQWSGALALG